ncbi:MAG: hypothetical protein HY320_16440 [Armatimonadetes bacterium]|nr:hypothetical protein [Armatimonadota bacterium]
MRTVVARRGWALAVAALVVLLVEGFPPSVAAPRATRPARADYFPLRKGNTWNYVSAAAHAALPPQEFSTTIDAVRRSTTTGTAWYQLTNYQGGDHWVRKTGKGRILERPDHLWYQFEAAPGTSWKMSIREGFPGSDGATLTLASRSETVRVPAGVFENCIRIDYAHQVVDAGIIAEWFAPGIGLVQREEARIFGPLVTRLKSAVVNGRQFPVENRGR